MAEIICTSDTYITAAKCYTSATLNNNQRQALLLYAMAIQLNQASTGASNYLNSLSTTLLTDATRATCGITPDQVEAAKLAIWFAATGDATTLTAKLDAVKCLANADMEVMKKAEMMLLCKTLSVIAL